KLGTKRTLVVSGDDGLGDVTLAAATNVSDVRAATGAPVQVNEFTWQPQDFGINRANLEKLHVDGPAASAAIIRRLLAGERGPARDIVLLNAAASLIVANKRSDPKTATEIAANAIDSGAAEQLLNKLIQKSHAPV